jgi:nucleoside-diphosphate-sugar epimerase
MKNICVIGATGKLGKYLMTLPNTIACPIRFEQADQYHDWFEKNSSIDTVWHVARSCRKTGIRRDFQTLFLEYNAMNKLMKTRAKKCRFVYASSKIVYGIDRFRCCQYSCSHNYTPLNVKEVSKYFLDALTGTYNCPDWQKNLKISTDTLDIQGVTYAYTKLFNEKIIQSHCKNFKILRIWDIV